MTSDHRRLVVRLGLRGLETLAALGLGVGLSLTLASAASAATAPSEADGPTPIELVSEPAAVGSVAAPDLTSSGVVLPVDLATPEGVPIDGPVDGIVAERPVRPLVDGPGSAGEAVVEPLPQAPAYAVTEAVGGMVTPAIGVVGHVFAAPVPGFLLRPHGVHHLLLAAAPDQGTAAVDQARVPVGEPHGQRVGLLRSSGHLDGPVPGEPVLTALLKDAGLPAPERPAGAPLPLDDPAPVLTRGQVDEGTLVARAHGPTMLQIKAGPERAFAVSSVSGDVSVRPG